MAQALHLSEQIQPTCVRHHACNITRPGGMLCVLPKSGAEGVRLTAHGAGEELTAVGGPQLQLHLQVRQRAALAEVFLRHLCIVIDATINCVYPNINRQAHKQHLDPSPFDSCF